MKSQDIEDGSTFRQISEEEMRQRKNKAVKAWLVWLCATQHLCFQGSLPDNELLSVSRHWTCWQSSVSPLSELQEHQVGKEKLDVVQILQAHHVMVRGGPEEGNKLIKALLVSSLA